MSRPRGEIRRAIDDAFAAICRERGPLVFKHGITHTETAQRAKVGFGAARTTMQNMARAGALSVLGVRPEPGVNRGRVRYAPVSQEEQRNAVALDDVLRLWSGAR